MDFTFSDDQGAIRDLARGILEKEVTVERLQRLERAAEWHDAALWATLAQAALLGVLELCVLLQELGRVVAPGDFLATLVAAHAIAAHGNPERRRELLPAVARGEATLALALQDARGSDPTRPGTSAERDGRGVVLNGEKRHVLGAARAQRILVPASAGDDAHLLLVDP